MSAIRTCKSGWSGLIADAWFSALMAWSSFSWGCESAGHNDYESRETDCV